MAYLTNTSVNGDLGVSGLTSVGSAGLKFTSGIINIFGSSNSGGTGNYSISIGDGAAATGFYSVALGYKAKTSATETVAIGDEANTSGSNSIAIGYGAGATEDKGIAIGRSAKTTAGVNIGAANVNNGYTYIRVGSSYIGSMSSTSGWNLTSDIRDKLDFKPIISALDFINSIEPVTFVNNIREDYIDDNGDFNNDAYLEGKHKGHRRIAGFKAQDVYDTLNKIYGTDNYANIVSYNKYDDPESADLDRYSMNYNAMIPFLTRAIQEQQKEIQVLKDEINNLKKHIV